MMYDVQQNTDAQHQRRDERSLGELFGDLTHELGTLVQQEMSLAKAEMSQKAARAGRNVGFLAVGGAIAYAGLLALIAAVILGITAAGLPAWASALIVGGVIAGIGGMLVMKGMATLKNMDPLPRETMRTLQEDEEWAKQQIK